MMATRLLRFVDSRTGRGLSRRLSTSLAAACLIVLGASLASPWAATEAHASRPDLELVIGPSFFNASAASASPVLSEAGHAAGRLEAAVSLMDSASGELSGFGLDLRLSGSFLEDEGNVLGGFLRQRVGLATGAVGIKATYALLNRPHWTLNVVGQLDFELVHAWYEASAAGAASATGYAWGFGVQPQSGLEAIWSPNSAGDFGVVFRLVAGFAWRTDSALSDMADPGSRSQFAETGSPNFSGVTATFTAGMRF